MWLAEILLSPHHLPSHAHQSIKGRSEEVNIEGTARPQSQGGGAGLNSRRCNDTYNLQNLHSAPSYPPRICLAAGNLSFLLHFIIPFNPSPHIPLTPFPFYFWRQPRLLRRHTPPSLQLSLHHRQRGAHHPHPQSPTGENQQ